MSRLRSKLYAGGTQACGRFGLCAAAVVALLAFAASALAQNAPPAGDRPAGDKPSHSTRLILLGTNGGPSVTSLRSEPASLLIADGRGYLIDVGDGVTRRLFEAGWFYPPGKVNRIFITHHHLDHDGGLVALMALTWTGAAFTSPQTPPVEIFGPPATSFLVQTALQFIGVSERIFRAGIPDLMPAAPLFKAHDIDHDGVVYTDDQVRVTAAENSHFQIKSASPQTGQDRSYSYRFDTAAGAVVFTGDSGPSEALTRLAEGADVLVTEVRTPSVRSAGSGDPAVRLPPELLRQQQFHMEEEHMTPEAVGKMAAAAHVKTVVLTHFLPGRDEVKDMTAFTAGVQKYFKGPVIAGKDLFEYDLNAAAP